MSNREHWLNGWPRIGFSVLIGSGVHCIGCGTFHGVTCVAIPEDWQPPEKMPDWPFEQDSCPVCQLVARASSPTTEHVPPTLAERLSAFKAAKRRRSDPNGAKQ